MRSSRWQAQGNVYLVAEEPLTAELVREGVGDADGILEVRDRGADWLRIAIWNPDGSLAEMSGNGTRIAAAWLAEQTEAAAITVWVGERGVPTRVGDNGVFEQELGPVAVGEPGHRLFNPAMKRMTVSRNVQFDELLLGLPKEDDSSEWRMFDESVDQLFGNSSSRKGKEKMTEPSDVVEVSEVEVRGYKKQSRSVDLR